MSEWQLRKIQQVMGEYPEVFRKVPRVVRRVEPHIPMLPSQVDCVQFCPTPHRHEGGSQMGSPNHVGLGHHRRVH